MAMVADVDAANIAVHLDSYHMNIEEDAMALAVAACGDKLGCEPGWARFALPAMRPASHSMHGCCTAASACCAAAVSGHSVPSSALCTESWGCTCVCLL